MSTARSAGLTVIALAATLAAVAPSRGVGAEQPAAAPAQAEAAPQSSTPSAGAAPSGAPPPATTPDRARAEPLRLEPGKPVEIVCETRAVSVADEAQATTGQIRLKLEATGQPAATANDGGKDKADAAVGASGTWSISDVAAGHIASFALKHKDACGAKPCPFEPGHGSSLSLWAPVKIMPDKLEAGASMSLGALDASALTLRVSSFRDGAIAALEQGDCKLAP